MDRFHFTVTDLARFLGKSAVTLRGWERQGLLTLPRDSNGDRRLTSEDVRVAAKRANELGRISEKRLHYVESAVTLLTLIERENKDAYLNRINRSPRVREDKIS